MNELEDLIEAILFYRGEPVTIADLAHTAHTTPEKVEEVLVSLAERLEAGGTRLVREGKHAALATAPEAAEIIAKLRKEELEGPLGKAGLETLSIVIYQGPVSRADIEYVRGVNCTSILRSLTMRGLVERIENPDGRGYAYQATVDLPAALGITSLKNMPAYDEMKQEIQAVVDSSHQSNEILT
jgi:segregation and condensation protein B